MSTYDWVEIYRGPCRCGAGEFVVEFGTPDHPYPTKSRAWQMQITCKACGQEYELVRQDGQVIAVRRDGLQKRRFALKEWSEKRDALLSSPQTGALLAEAERRLEGMTLASAHDAVGTFVHTYGTVGTFRKHVKRAGGIGRWLRGAIQTGNVLKLAEWLGLSDRELQAQWAEVEALWTEGNAPLPSEDRPLCHEKGDLEGLA